MLCTDVIQRTGPEESDQLLERRWQSLKRSLLGIADNANRRSGRSANIATAKLKLGMETLDLDQAAAIKQTWEQMAQERGLPKDLFLEVYDLLHDSSVEVQDKVREKLSEPEKPPRSRRQIRKSLREWRTRLGRNSVDIANHIDMVFHLVAGLDLSEQDVERLIEEATQKRLEHLKKERARVLLRLILQSAIQAKRNGEVEG